MENKSKQLKLPTGAINTLILMKDGVGLTFSSIYETYRMRGFSVNKRSVERLISEGLIEMGGSFGHIGGYLLKLTDLGKSIEL